MPRLVQPGSELYLCWFGCSFCFVPADGESLLGSGRGQQLMKTLCKLIAEHPCNEFSKQDQDKPLRLASLSH